MNAAIPSWLPSRCCLKMCSSGSSQRGFWAGKQHFGGLTWDYLPGLVLPGQGCSLQSTFQRAQPGCKHGMFPFSQSNFHNLIAKKAFPRIELKSPF